MGGKHGQNSDPLAPSSWLPVLGPARCASTITHGISDMEARPKISTMSERPGPEVADIAFLPRRKRDDGRDRGDFIFRLDDRTAELRQVLFHKFQISDAG